MFVPSITVPLPDRREDILELLRAGTGGEEQKALASNEALIRSLVRRVRTDGFGSNHGDWVDQGKIGAVAVAIVFEERVLASLNVVFLTRAVSLAEAKRRYVPELQTAAREMVEELAAEEIHPQQQASVQTLTPT
jgi:IclR family mhp operon transcriptional activator